jgi:hypothetical protein
MMKKIMTLSMLFTATMLFAQEEEKKLTISGSVDAYFQTYLTTPDNVGASFGTAFADQTGFAVGMANVIASYEGENVGAVLDLVTGPRGAAATFNSDIIDGIVNQAYVYWNVSEGTTLTFGRFNTFLGYEVIAPAANFNYSTSYLFSNGPFSHMGLKVDFALSDDFSLMLAVTNPWDTNNISTTGEYFALHGDANNLPSVVATTLTGSYTIENLIIKPEIRLDSWSNSQPYVDNDGVASDNLAAFTLAAIVSF